MIKPVASVISRAVGRARRTKSVGQPYCKSAAAQLDDSPKRWNPTSMRASTCCSLLRPCMRRSWHTWSVTPSSRKARSKIREAWPPTTRRKHGKRRHAPTTRPGSPTAPRPSPPAARAKHAEQADALARKRAELPDLLEEISHLEITDERVVVDKKWRKWLTACERVQEAMAAGDVAGALVADGELAAATLASQLAGAGGVLDPRAAREAVFRFAEPPASACPRRPKWRPRCSS